MKLTVNGLVREVEAGTSVEQLVAAVRGGLAIGTSAPPGQPSGFRRTGRVRPPARPSSGRPGYGVVVTVNGAVVPRSTWATTQLRDRDVLEILTATPQS